MSFIIMQNITFPMSLPIKIFLFFFILIPNPFSFALQQLEDAQLEKVVISETTPSHKLFIQAEKLSKNGQFYKAAKMFEKSAHAEKQSRIPNLALMYSRYNTAALLFTNVGRYKEAVVNYDRTLEIAKELGVDKMITISLNNVGMAYQMWGHYDAANTYLQETLSRCETLGNFECMARTYLNIGTNALRRGQHDKALIHLKQAMKLNKNLKQMNHAATALNSIGWIYQIQGKYEQAQDSIAQAMAIDIELGMEDKRAVRLTTFGKIFAAKQKFNLAEEYHLKAMSILDQISNKEQRPTILYNLASLYSGWGKYDMAIARCHEALSIDQAMDQEMGHLQNVAIGKSKLGDIFMSWGDLKAALQTYQDVKKIYSNMNNEIQMAKTANKFGKLSFFNGQYGAAIEYFKGAIEVNHAYEYKTAEAEGYNHIANVNLSLGKYEEALKYYEQELEIRKQLGMDAFVATSFRNIARIQSSLGNYDKSLEFYQKSLEINQRLGLKDAIASDFASIGSVYFIQKQYDLALKNYQKAIQLFEQCGSDTDIADNLHNVGVVYIKLGQSENAEAIFKKAIKIKEVIYKEAVGKLRRDALNSLIDTSQMRLSAFVKLKAYSKALNIVEYSKSMLIAEHTGRAPSIGIPSLADIQKKITDDTALIIYANVVNGLKIIQIVITSDDIYGHEIDQDEFIAQVKKNHHTSMDKILQLKLTKNRIRKPLFFEQPSGKENRSFADIIYYYQQLLSNSQSVLNVQSHTINGNGIASKIEHLLYNLLIQPIGKNLKNKKNLIIVPDGILGLLPFETLMDSNGKYLVESYDISYIPSTAILQTIRDRNYLPDREPIIAFGKGTYDDSSISAEKIVTEQHLNALSKKAYYLFDKNRSLRQIYTQLNLVNPQNFAEDLRGLNSIKTKFRKPVIYPIIYKGDQVTENKIKSLSKKGTLSQFKTIHFSLPMVVLSEIPELSALMFSQLKNDNTEEDGFLNVKEISNLNLKADNVNLSWYQTAQSTGGSGETSLISAFFIAGANGLSVSLWQIKGETPFPFLIEPEKSEKNDRKTIVNRLKRKILRGAYGQKYATPYYWAPLIYFGSKGVPG